MIACNTSADHPGYFTPHTRRPARSAKSRQ